MSDGWGYCPNCAARIDVPRGTRLIVGNCLMCDFELTIRVADSSMREDKWRVSSLHPLASHAWGIWPPGWDLAGKPLLMFPTQAKAFTAAAARADFAENPPVAQEEWETQ